MAVDPVCGMSVDPSRTAGRVEHEGKTYYFCSTGCVTKFSADPKKYLSGTREPMQPHVLSIGGLKKQQHPTASTEHPTASTEHLTASTEHPTASTEVSELVEFTCPMHPEVVRNGPGACPICGMAL